MKIEDLLLNINKVNQITEANAYETLKEVLSEQVRPLVQDHLLTEDEADLTNDLPYDEVTDDSSTELPIEPDAQELPMELPVEDAPTEDMLGSNGDELSGDDLALSDDTDTEVLDLSDATFDEVMAALKDLPDDTEIVIKKNQPTFDVDVNAGSSEEGSMFDESEIFEEENTDTDADDLYESIIFEQKNIIQEYEQKLNKLQSQLQAEQKNVLELKEKQLKYDTVLLESHKSLENLLVYNTNLTNITKLFTEQTVTKNEKVQIIEQFQKAVTVNESKLLYETFVNNLKKTPINEDVEKIKKQIETNKISVQDKPDKVVIKEQKTYSDPALSMFDRVTKHKI